MSTAIYVAIVEGSQDEGYSAFFPDLPGCVTAAESMLELPAAARDALSLHLAGMMGDGEVLPDPTAIEDIPRDPEVKEVGRLIIDVDVEDAPVRVNISIGAQVLKRIDVAAEARGMTRSGFLVEAARAMIEERSDTHGRLRPALPSLLLHDDWRHSALQQLLVDVSCARMRSTYKPSYSAVLRPEIHSGRCKSGWSLFSTKPVEAAAGVLQFVDDPRSPKTCDG